ncbi:hypothetical protein [Methanoculleus chikugoensis]|uniref:hypothetical protein n=1 Tax=Methanoculleus chikugoensis TaxID=118126 RepID=UPI001FB20F26|nr:hypothetical protein [Methanoculleus chikugoensis]
MAERSAGRVYSPSPDDDVVGVLRHLAVAGGGVGGAADDRYAAGLRDLVAIHALVDGVQAIEGDVGTRPVRRPEVVSVHLARCGKRGEGVVRQGGDLSPVDLHICCVPAVQPALTGGVPGGSVCTACILPISLGTRLR